MNWLNPRAKRFVLGALVIIVGVLLYVVTRTPVAVDLEAYARDVMDTCRDVAYAPSCYDREIPALLDRLTMEEAFEVTKIVQKYDSRYLYCHVLAHNISSKEVSKDPERWGDVLTRCPITMCNNGCPHGALMERFSAESLDTAQIATVKPELVDACEPRDDWAPTEVERSMCYHGIGHLLMYITDADVRQSAQLCEEIGTKSDGRNYVQTCTEGSVMSVFQPLEPEDFALIEDIAPTSKDEVVPFCAQFSDMPMLFHACRRESWPQFLDTMRSDPGGVVRFCAYTDNPTWQKVCMGTAMNILTIYLVVNENGNLDSLERYCDRLDGTWASQCYAFAAQRLIQIDPGYKDTAVRTCELTKTPDQRELCFDGLLYYASFSFHAGSSALSSYCSSFPDEYRTQCLDQSVASY